MTHEQIFITELLINSLILFGNKIFVTTHVSAQVENKLFNCDYTFIAIYETLISMHYITDMIVSNRLNN